MADKAMWGIHAGKTGDADELFFEMGCVALGWQMAGDLSALADDREAFKAPITECYPDSKPGAIPVQAGQLYRFVHEMQVGDIVVYPSKRDRQVHIGRVTGPYEYDSSGETGYPQRRQVEWQRYVPRTVFSQGALFEIGSAMSLFQVKNYAEEYRLALEGKPIEAAAGEDDTVGPVAEEIDRNTRDFIIKRLSRGLKGHPLEGFVAHLLEIMGYQTRVAAEGTDGGIDIVAHRDQLGLEPPIIKVQVKSGDGSVGDPVVSALYGKVGREEYGLLVTLGTFTSQAKSFALGKTNLRLIDGDELVDLVLQHYDALDSRYKGFLPLKRLYVPEALDEGAE